MIVVHPYPGSDQVCEICKKEAEGTRTKIVKVESKILTKEKS